MPKIYDLVGRTFGRLTVTARHGAKRENGRSNIQWLCTCSCGKRVFLTSNTLTQGTKSCGCLVRDAASIIGKLHPPPSTAIDLTGQVFGRLTAIRSTSQRVGSSVLWQCMCSCGNTHYAACSYLLNGSVGSCGCSRKDANITHGASRKGQWTTEYVTWSGMIDRCRNPNNPAFERYGGRGILVCERWHKFENFFDDMGPRPDSLTLERSDNNKGYEPGNCVWATYKVQNRNRRDNKTIEFNGSVKCVSEWAEILGMRPGLILKRLSLGWSAGRALSTKPRPITRRA